jgi:hypothetical protein
MYLIIYLIILVMYTFYFKLIKLKKQKRKYFQLLNSIERAFGHHHRAKDGTPRYVD